MKVTQHIEKANGNTLFTLEILPPLKGQTITSIFNTIDPLMEFNPPFIDVTYHREEYVYKELENGLLQKQVVRKRPGTVGICAAIQNKYNVDAIPHILCGGFTKEDTELVSQISDLNKGIYLDDEIQNQAKTDFCIGVAGYPEKHMEAPSMDSDIYFLKKKIKKGATYIVTQMFFDNEKYFAFVNKCRAEGITVPIIPGLKPLATKKQLNLIPHRFSAELPDDLIMEVVKCKNNEAVREVGVEWCVNQCKGLIVAGVPILHFYSMGKSDNIKAIAAQVF